MTTPLVSVVIPTFNHAPLLKIALQSVIAQTFINWEAIVVNNFSTDATVEVVESFNDSRIKLINLGIDNLTLNDYNNLLKSSKFYNFIPTETFMIFQTDSMILPKYKHYINYFLNYDYVGAPWNNKLVGNGGLSIRKKSKMLEIINIENKKKRFYLMDKNKNINEDGFFSLNKMFFY